MGKLIYGLNVSLDGFVETLDKSLDWAVVDDEIHQWFNDRARKLEASIYGRGLYETMAGYWPTAENDPAATPVMVEFARIWNALPKFVFSKSLESVQWNSRLVRGDVADSYEIIREEFSGDIEIGGATLAHSFIERGLIDEFQLIVHPVSIGAGTPFFPHGKRMPLRLTETQTFSSGIVYMAYVKA